MKQKLVSPLLFGLCFLTSLATAQQRQAPEPRANPVFTEREIILSGSFLGSGEPYSVILLDRDTGLYQVGLRDRVSGAISWGQTRSSGLPAIDDAALGRLDPRDVLSVGVAHADSNQLSFSRPHADKVGAHPRRITAPVALPGLIAGGQMDLRNVFEETDIFYEDFALVSQLRRANSGHLVQTLNFLDGLSTPNIFAEGELPSREEAGNAPHQLSSIFFPNLAVPVVAQDAPKAGGGVGTRLTIIRQDTGGTFGFQHSDPFGVPGQRFVAIPFFDQNAELDAMLVSWNSAEPVLYSFFPEESHANQMQECNLDDYESGIEQVIVLEDGMDGLARILVIAEEGAMAAIHEHNGLYCWGSMEHSIEAGVKDSIFLAAAPDGEGGFTLLSGPPDGRAENWATYERDGDDYNLLDEGEIPVRDERLRVANLFAYAENPFLNPDSTALDMYRFKDWTLGAASSGVLEATGLEFQGGAIGLGPDASTETIAPGLDAFFLPNQIAPNMSVATLVPIGAETTASIGVEPLPGEFDRSIRVRFNTSLPNAEIYYRSGNDQIWQQVSTDGEPVLYQDTTLLFFAESEGGISAIRSATYTFTRTFDEFDSNRDGLPDFVRDYYGLDPQGPPDTTGNGYTDLEEILGGSDPLDPADVPADQNRLMLGTRFNAEAFIEVQDLTQLPGIGFVSAEKGVLVHAADTSGTELGQGRVDHAVVGGGFDTYGARITGIEPNPARPYFTLGTRSLFSDESDQLIPEKVTLQPMPRLPLPEIDYTPSGVDLETEVNHWLAAASNVLSGVERETFATSLSALSTLQTAVFERHLALLWEDRAELSSTPAVTLMPQRSGDGSRVALSREEWRLFARPDITDPVGPRAVDLRDSWQNLDDFLAAATSDRDLVAAFARDLYRAHRENFIPGETSARPPLDAFRYFLENNGDLPAFYADHTSLDDPDLSDVYGILDNLTRDISLSRPVTTVLAEIKETTFSGRCRLVAEVATYNEYLLLNEKGEAYRFPSGLRLPAGTVVSITGFTDAEPTDQACEIGANSLEVFSVDLTLLPVSLDADKTGNLLPESWEELHFGAAGQDALADASGNGYSNLEHYLRGRSPLTTASISQQAPIDFSPPQLRIQPDGNGDFSIEWEYGEDLAGNFNFRFEKSTDLVDWIPHGPSELQQTPQGVFQAIVAPSNEKDGRKTFYRFQIELRADQ